MKQAHDLDVFADYFQLYVQDLKSTDDFSGDWTDATVEAMLVVKPTALAIGTARNMTVPVRLEVHEIEPPDEGGWDRQNEASVRFPSGWLQVIGCAEYGPDAFQTPINPGPYRARISYFALDGISADGLDGDDRYLVQLWPAPPDPA